MTNNYMTIKDNFASFMHPLIGKRVYVDSFDNIHFNVRIGTVEESVPLGTVVAYSDEQLNEELEKLLTN